MRRLSPGHRFYPALLVLLLLAEGCARKSHISFSYQGAFASNDSIAAQPNTGVRVSWTKDGVFPGRDLVLEEYEQEGPFSTAHSGNIHIDFALLNNGAPSSTKGSVELPLQSDWGWGVDFWVGDTDPMDMCFGCVGSLEFPLDPTLGYPPSKKLYVVYGGNSISDPVTY